MGRRTRKAEGGDELGIAIVVARHHFFFIWQNTRQRVGSAIGRIICQVKPLFQQCETRAKRASKTILALCRLCIKTAHQQGGPTTPSGQGQERRRPWHHHIVPAADMTSTAGAAPSGLVYAGGDRQTAERAVDDEVELEAVKDISGRRADAAFDSAQVVVDEHQRTTLDGREVQDGPVLDESGSASLDSKALWALAAQHVSSTMCIALPSVPVMFSR